MTSTQFNFAEFDAIDRLANQKPLELEKRVQAFWQAIQLEKRCLAQDDTKPQYTFYEGPPSANGLPGLHHVMARTIKDIFCRYKTQGGYYVLRRGGWDTHGLPVELAVEKELNITKEEIGKKISIADYNALCKKAVVRYTKEWETLTKKMGFCLDLQRAYHTYTPSYIESVWWLLGQLYEKDLLYQGHKIQPYSPAAGTALSQHELNQPGCYKEITDLSLTAQFKLVGELDTFLLAWTTTPWTLPANSALAIHKDIVYVCVRTPAETNKPSLRLWLAEECLSRYFEEQKPVIEKRCRGEDMLGWRYEQLMPYVPHTSERALRVYAADFVNTQEGTGIVHISLTFGSDDHALCLAEDIPGVLVKDEANEDQPIVDKQGRFVSAITDFAGMEVKAFGSKGSSHTHVDKLIAEKLNQEGRAFSIKAHKHSYPHCWRTDKPIIYYPIQSWFIRISAWRERLVALNKQVHWQPPATGTGRFDNWLAELSDWNLSRSRFWGTPLPIWRSRDKKHTRCIASFKELRQEVDKAIAAGINQEAVPKDLDPHRPHIDQWVLGTKDQPLYREPDVIDVWFDSGAMPYAQWHYPFEHRARFEKHFPADFICEAVDQTRGWFFSLHAIAGLVFEKPAYRQVLSCGLVLDKEGRKMSKRLGNAIDPTTMMSTHGADATRWYLMSGSSPWENLRFDLEGLTALRRGFFSTWLNSLDFFLLYARLDSYVYEEKSVPALASRSLLDQWLGSRIASLHKACTKAYDAYSPREVCQLLERFVSNDLSNWYVRLCRKRFWQGEMNADKAAAYASLYEALRQLSLLAAPVAPFSSELSFQLLERLKPLGKEGESEGESVHLTQAIAPNTSPDKAKEEAMAEVQRICSLSHALRKRHRLKVRQPLSSLLVLDVDGKRTHALGPYQGLILRELNLKEVDFCA